MPHENAVYLEEFEKNLWLSFRQQVQRFSKKIEITIFCAVAQASADCAEIQNRHFSKNPELVELGIRDTIFSLQLILSNLSRIPDAEGLIPTFKEFQMSEKQARGIQDLFQAASKMSVMYDIFKSLKTHGYKVERVNDDHIIFRDADDWEGSRDYAQREISAIVKRARAERNLKNKIEDALAAMVESVALPPEIPLFSTTVRSLSRSWVRILIALKPAFLSGQMIIESNSSLFRILKEAIGGSDGEVNSILGLWRFGFNQPFERSLFFHPIIPFSKNESFFFVYSLFHARMEVAISRYLIYRTKTYGNYSNAIEEYLIGKLENHFGREDQVFLSNIKFVFEGVQLEIDSTIYEKSHGRVSIVESKYFVLPDSVQEVMNCNKTLSKAIFQVDRIRKWVNSENGVSIRRWLNIDMDQPLEFRYLVIGNGFSGSNFLENVEMFPIIDYQYLLQDKFFKSDFGEAVEGYSEDFRRYAHSIVNESGQHRFELYGKIIDAPYSKKVEY